MAKENDDDRLQRALAAGEQLTVGDKVYALRPVVSRNLMDLQKQALKYYKREYLETFTENMDLLGANGDASEIMREELTKAAQWTLDDLPKKVAYDARRCPITKEVKEWIERTYGDVPTMKSKGGRGKPVVDDKACGALMTVSLDGNRISSAEVEKLSGRKPLQGSVRYDNWWITGCIDGMVQFLANSVRDESGNRVASSEIGDWPFLKITEAVKTVEALTTANMSNT